ncbi:hypothetical protein SprV_0100159700 [Sparganum proliferum]
MENAKCQANDAESEEGRLISPEDAPKPDSHNPRIYTREPDEKTFCCSSKVILKVLKPGCKLSQRQSRAQDHGGIVLGPQKRSWNIGCHVSQPKRGVNESSHIPKQSKVLSDRHFSKQPEAKREAKVGDRTSPTGFRGRDKAYNKPSISGSLFSRPYGQPKMEASSRTRDPDSFSSEKEPEWFSEGPATINDTVELVGMIDEGVESSKENNVRSLKCGEHKAENEPAATLPVEDSAVISVSVKEEIPPVPKTTSAGNADLDFLKILENPKPEVTGSRFRHLFTKAEQKSPNENTEDINTKLRKLLAGVDKAASPIKPLFDKSAADLSQVQPTASELETALRSLLLGKTSSGPMSTFTKNAAPTVQEIESAVLQASSDSRTSLCSREVLQPLCLSSIQDKQTPDGSLTAADPQSWILKSTTNADVRSQNLPFDATPLTTCFAQPQPSRQQLNILSSLEPRQIRDPAILSKLQGTYPSSRVPQSKAPDPRRCQWEEVLSSAAGQKNALNGLISKINSAYSTAVERVPGSLSAPPPLYAHCPPFLSTSTHTTALLPQDPAVQPNRRPIVKSFQFIDEGGDSRMQNTRSDMPAVPPPPGLLSYNRTNAPLATGMNPQSIRDLEAILQWNLKNVTQQQQQRAADSRKTFPVSAPSAPQFFSRFPSLSSTSAQQMLSMPPFGSMTASGSTAFGGQGHFAQLESFVSKPSVSTPGMKPNFSSPELVSTLPMRWQNQLPVDNQAGSSLSTTDLFRSVTEVEALAPKGL